MCFVPRDVVGKWYPVSSIDAPIVSAESHGDATPHREQKRMVEPSRCPLHGLAEFTSDFDRATRF